MCVKSAKGKLLYALVPEISTRTIIVLTLIQGIFSDVNLNRTINKTRVNGRAGSVYTISFISSYMVNNCIGKSFVSQIVSFKIKSADKIVKL